MSEFVVVLDKPNGMKRKTVVALLEDDAGERRQVVRRKVSIEVDAGEYVADNFDELWADAKPLADDDAWDGAVEKSQRGLYRDVVLSGVGRGRGKRDNLADLTQAMEDALLASGKAEDYQGFKALVMGAPAAKRDAFFMLVGYLVLNDILAED